ncbi:DUF2461 domain-containing protein [Fulvivirgaceae bacterium BMA10]|uniref:DUF2461 domain-containing protein n=1 Tax=Splendidivirga corallicola TaxID=3051826 RepID=A0ABT8KW57_9BACT|nr:DUF2461 domain-containing protein [Fulvivirgaceae bacterium BMA10]
MTHFNPDFIDFFVELERNNNKAWFDENRKRYESSVKEPFAKFVDQLISAIQKYDPSIQISAKEAILRINRDIRFSKDKRPYNPYYTAFISPTGRKDKTIPGFFLRFAPDMIGVMVGCFGPSKEQLHNIRVSVINQQEEFDQIINDENFVKQFGSIKGDISKRLPVQFKRPSEQYPLIANKAFYFSKHMDADLITSENLHSILMELWHVAKPLNQFLYSAITRPLLEVEV